MGCFLPSEVAKYCKSKKKKYNKNYNMLANDKVTYHVTTITFLIPWLE